MDINLDPNVLLGKEPLETLAHMKHQMSGRFQGINASYEALYQELHETRRRQGVLIDLVEKMYKTLQSTPNTNSKSHPHQYPLSPFYLDHQIETL